MRDVRGAAVETPWPGLSRRHALGLLAAALPIGDAGAASTAGEGVDVTAHGADPTGQRDSSEAFRKALAQSPKIRVPAGIYLLGNVELSSGASITGAGESSVLKQHPQARFAVLADSGSPRLSSNLRAIRLSNLQLRGSCDSDGFSEFVHLVSLNGVSDVVVDNVLFRGFRGDGLYIGSGNIGGQERHNTQVTLRNCVFDGINHQNRNGVSVIDCDGLVIEDCRFINTTKADMPGAIDLEPDGESFHVVRNAHIARNTFIGVGGHGGAIAIYIPRGVLTKPTGILIENNTIDDALTNAFSFEQPAGMRGPAADTTQLVFRGNRIHRCAARPFRLRGVEGAVLSDNLFADTLQDAQIGFDRPEDDVHDVTLRDNVFERCGSHEDAGLQVFSASDVRFERNSWLDCGNGARDSSAVRFASGSSQRVRFAGNTFASATHRTAHAVSAAPGRRFDAGGNVFAPDNQLKDGLTNAFDRPDS